MNFVDTLICELCQVQQYTACNHGDMIEHTQWNNLHKTATYEPTNGLR